MDICVYAISRRDVVVLVTISFDGTLSTVVVVVVVARFFVEMSYWSRKSILHHWYSHVTNPSIPTCVKTHSAATNCSIYASCGLRWSECFASSHDARGGNCLAENVRAPRKYLYARAQQYLAVLVLSL